MTRTRFATPALFVLAALVVLLLWPLGAGSASASAGAGPETRAAGQAQDSVLVTGKGEVFGKPDVLTADFAVEIEASTVDEALDRAGAAATRMRDALVDAGIAEADLQTSNLGIGSNMNDEREITGYTVNQGLTAKIRDLPRAGAIMSASVAAGGDAARLNGVSFAIEDDAALLREARTKAFADARAKAELYAREAGRSLGRVVTISEAAPSYGVPAGQDSMAGDPRFPIEPGRQQVAVTVTVEWALSPVTGPAKP